MIEGEGLGGFARRVTSTIVPKGCSAPIGVFLHPNCQASINANVSATRYTALLLRQSIAVRALTLALVSRAF